MKRSLLLVCLLFGPSVGRATSNAYVSVDTDYGSVYCLGRDFLIIPDNPFGDKKVDISVVEQIGWILRSEHHILLAPGDVATWSVRGDSDNPEDWASGNIYVAKVTIGVVLCDILRSETARVPFSVRPSFAKDYICFFADMTDNTTARSTATVEDAHELSVSVDQSANEIVIANRIEKERKQAGAAAEQVFLHANNGTSAIMVNLKKDIKDFSSSIMEDLKNSVLEMARPSVMIEDAVTEVLRSEIPTAGLPHDYQDGIGRAIQQAGSYAATRSRMLVFSRFEDMIADYEKAAKTSAITSESWKWKPLASFTPVMKGGSVTFTPNRGLSTSLYRWASTIGASGSLSFKPWEIQTLSFSTGISADGYTALGKGSLSMKLTVSFFKDFLEGGDLQFSTQGNVSIGFDLNFRLDF